MPSSLSCSRLVFRLNADSKAGLIPKLSRSSSEQPKCRTGSRTSPSPFRPGDRMRGRGLEFMHYKGNETYVAVAMEVEVNVKSGVIQVTRMACAHDGGLVVNPYGVRSPIEGNLLQTLSWNSHAGVKFVRSRVNSTDWVSYRILTFPEVPTLLINFIDRPHQPPLGAGEAADTPAPAALANAVFDACRIRLRMAPFAPDKVKALLAWGFSVGRF